MKIELYHTSPYSDIEVVPLRLFQFNSLEEIVAFLRSTPKSPPIEDLGTEKYKSMALEHTEHVRRVRAVAELFELIPFGHNKACDSSGYYEARLVED